VRRPRDWIALPTRLAHGVRAPVRSTRRECLVRLCLPNLIGVFFRCVIENLLFGLDGLLEGGDGFFQGGDAGVAVGEHFFETGGVGIELLEDGGGVDVADFDEAENFADFVSVFAAALSLSARRLHRA
jgi:hypothetical protein